MEDNIELEEEACYHKDDDEDNIDLDSLSYIVRAYLTIVLTKFLLFPFEFALLVVWMINEILIISVLSLMIEHGFSMYQCVCFMRRNKGIEKL